MLSLFCVLDGAADVMLVDTTTIEVAVAIFRIV
jgi:hypothetical protein